MQEKIIGIGALLVDEIFYADGPVKDGSSNPATMQRSAGGVMRNIMHHLALLDCAPVFISVAGNDSDGDWLLKTCMDVGINMQYSATMPAQTGKYAAILNPDGTLYAAVASNPCETFLNTEFLQSRLEVLLTAGTIIADTNLSMPVLEWLVLFCKSHSIELYLEPVSVSKAAKLKDIVLDGVFMITPNEEELAAISAGDCPHQQIDALLGKSVKNVWLRSGEKGSAIYRRNQSYRLAAPKVEVEDTTGAGDAALAGWVAWKKHGFGITESLKAAHTLAALVLQTKGAVAGDINFNLLKHSITKYYPGE